MVDILEVEAARIFMSEMARSRLARLVAMAEESVICRLLRLAQKVREELGSEILEDGEEECCYARGGLDRH